MRVSLVSAIAAFVLLAAVRAEAQDRATTRLRAFEEVPALSTPGNGVFRAVVADDEIAWELSYQRLQGNVLQAHIHLGQRGVNGGIMLFLCSNLGNGPAGTPACPASPGELSGTLTAADVVGPGAQGVGPGEFAEVLRVIRGGVSYVNVHTDLFTGGEIRGQLSFVRDDDAAAAAAAEPAFPDHDHRD